MVVLIKSLVYVEMPELMVKNIYITWSYARN